MANLQATMRAVLDTNVVVSALIWGGKLVSRDPDDDVVLSVAVAAKANLIVSGDRDLLVLGNYVGIPIVTPAQAVAMLEV